MTIVKGILKEEHERLERLLQKYEEALSAIPKGSLRQRKIGNRSYLYRVFRDGQKVRSEYLGKAGQENLRPLLDQEKKRKMLIKNIRAAQADLNEIRRALGNGIH